MAWAPLAPCVSFCAVLEKSHLRGEVDMAPGIGVGVCQAVGFTLEFGVRDGGPDAGMRELWTGVPAAS